MNSGVRYKCNSCGWHGYRRSVRPCPKCKSDVERYPSSYDIIPFTDEMKKFIHKNYKKMLYLEIAEALGTSESKVCNYINRTGLRLSPEEFERRKSIGKFKPGQISWNTGLTLNVKPNSGMFKKGQLPTNTLHDGAIVWRKRTNRKNADYYWIRISQAKWQMLHVYLWEKKYGPLPAGKILRFKDGDHKNCKLNNLELVTRAENLRMNYPEVPINLFNYDRYIAALLKVKGKKQQDWFIKTYPEMIEAKRQQLNLERGINETRR